MPANFHDFHFVEQICGWWTFHCFFFFFHFPFNSLALTSAFSLQGRKQKKKTNKISFACEKIIIRSMMTTYSGNIHNFSFQFYPTTSVFSRWTIFWVAFNSFYQNYSCFWNEIACYGIEPTTERCSICHLVKLQFFKLLFDKEIFFISFQWVRSFNEFDDFALQSFNYVERNYSISFSFFSFRSSLFQCYWKKKMTNREIESVCSRCDLQIDSIRRVRSFQ